MARLTVYVAGYPCGPWSRSVQMLGGADGRTAVTAELGKMDPCEADGSCETVLDRQRGK